MRARVLQKQNIQVATVIEVQNSNKAFFFGWLVGFLSKLTKYPTTKEAPNIATHL